MKLGEGVDVGRELEADESGPRSGKNGCLAPDDQDVVYVGPGAGRAAANASAAARRAQTFTRAAPRAARAGGGFSCGRFRSAERRRAARLRTSQRREVGSYRALPLARALSQAVGVFAELALVWHLKTNPGPVPCVGAATTSAEVSLGSQLSQRAALRCACS